MNTDTELRFGAGIRAQLEAMDRRRAASDARLDAALVRESAPRIAAITETVDRSTAHTANDWATAHPIWLADVAVMNGWCRYTGAPQ